MSPKCRRHFALFFVITVLCGGAFASAYNAHPKIVVVIVVDQLRGDLLERYHDQLPEGGFRMLMDSGAWFSNCNYQYANTRTAPGHATICTGAYTRGHGIRAGNYRESTEPVDLAATLSSMLGINAPNSSVGRVLNEALADNPVGSKESRR